ncbi:MAG: serine hydrolase domain-containing protein [Pseudohongiellaceae bacterium]
MPSKRKKVLLVSLVLVSLLAWKAVPYYHFVAFSDGATLPATPWVKLPQDAPLTRSTIESPYQAVGNELLSSMDIHRQAIGAAGISAAVLVGSEVVWAGASGWANIEENVPATPATRFRVGSTAKALTATGLARLVESGVMSLDTPLAQLWDVLPNEEWAEITPRQLASHMAGMPHYGSNTELSGLLYSVTLQDHYDSVHDALGLFDESELLFEPGTDFEYSSYGTVLNSAAMSKAAGQPYLQLMTDLVFEPNRMTGVVVSPADSAELPNMATPYHSNWKSGEALRLRPWRQVDLSHRLAGGGFAATSTDLVKLGRSYFHLSNPNAINHEIKEEFWTPQVLSSGEVNEQNYALGWRLREEEFIKGQPLRHVNHGGVSRGGQSWLMLLPEIEMAVALNINGRTEVFWDFGSFSFDIAKLFLQRKLALESETMQTDHRF